MLSWLKPNPAKRITAKRNALLQAAFEAQRNGNIREYSRLTYEAEQLNKSIAEISASQSPKDS